MLADSEKVPEVIPIWHIGMDDVLPNKRPYIPRLGKVCTLSLFPWALSLSLCTLSLSLCTLPAMMLYYCQTNIAVSIDLLRNVVRRSL